MSSFFLPFGAFECLEWIGTRTSACYAAGVTYFSNESDPPSALLPDWTREAKRSFFEWAPYKSLLSAIRCYQTNRDRTDVLSSVRWRLATARWRFWCVVGGLSIPLRCKIGGGLQMPHTNGIVINVRATIGCNCDIYQQVTIGEMKGGCPKIGNGVLIGPGAKILGPVTIGDGARIGANALVISDVPPGALVINTPSEIITP